MNKLLCGKTILVGRESTQGRLLVALSGIDKTAIIGSVGSVPGSVSRLKPVENAAHCKLSIDQSGNMVLTNMKPQNVTYVDGLQVEEKKITELSTIALGKDMYSISANAILEAASKLVDQERVQPGGPTPGTNKVFNISHLEHVWNGAQQKRRQIQAQQRKINLVRTACGIFTMCVMPSIFLLRPMGLEALAYVLTAIGIAGNIYSFWGMKSVDPNVEFEKITEELQDRYVCPNPECNKFLGNMNYNLLKKQYNMHCPYCKCKYVEK